MSPNTADNKLWHVKACPLLASMTQAELNEFGKLANVVSYGSKRVISPDTLETRYVWIVKRGHLKMNYTDAEGRQVAVVLLSPGDLFGALSSDPGNSFGEHCTALTPTCLYRIRKGDFESLISRHPELCLRITHAAFDRLQKLQVRLAEVMMRPAESRLAHALLELAQLASTKSPDGLVVDLPVTHKDLGELIGSTREMVSYVMRKFRDMNLVDNSRQQIVLLDVEGLKAVQSS